jgi:hypothetical protein
MKTYPRTDTAYHQSRIDNSDRIDALLAECEKMECDLNAARVVAEDAICEIERILRAGNIHGTREMIANLRGLLPK